MKKDFLWAMLGTTSLICSMPVLAQPMAVDSAQDSGLGEIIVTAQRRSENLQNVPIAVTAITGDQIIKSVLNKSDELVQAVPGLQLNYSGASLTPFLRGIGTNLSLPGNEPAVAFYIDDVYVPTGTAAVFRFNSISSIEVLKGPSGTLFGRNATGGVINIHSKDPSFDPTIDATVSYGNYQTVGAQLYASGGITDDIAVNIALQGSDQSKGWGVNVPTAQEVGKLSTWGARGKLLWDSHAATSLLVTGYYNWIKASQGYPGRSVPGTFSRDGFSPEAAGLGFYDQSWSRFSVATIKTYGFSAKLTQDLGMAKLVSISAYSHMKEDPFPLDGDGTPAVFFEGNLYGGSKTVTQEIQLLSPDDSKLKWILGAFYMHDDAFYSVRAFGSAFGTSTSLTYSRQKTTSISGFGQMTAEIMPRTNLTLGLRYTSDQRNFSGMATRTTPPSTVAVVGPFPASKTFKNISGRAAIDYKFTDDLMGYVAYNRGFKSGLFNLAAVGVGSSAAPPAVNPEDLDAYSIGFKSELLDRRLRINAEAYYYKYTNLQVNIGLPSGTILANAGGATVKGAEFEVAAKPFRNLTVNASISVLKGRYDDFQNAPSFFLLPPNAPTPYDPARCTGPNPYPAIAGAAPATQRLCDVSGNKMIQAAPFSSNLQLIYTIPSSVGDFDLTAAWSRGGNYNFDVFNAPYTTQPKTNIINGSIQWTLPGGHFKARLWTNNLTGEKYYALATTGSTGGAKYAAAAPRTYGITLGAHF